MKTKSNPWPKFNPAEYVRKNYEKMSIPDVVLATHLIEWNSVHGRSGQILEIGGAVNLYPIFIMLPFFEKIIVTDIVDENLWYLRSQQREMDTLWRQYIGLIRTLNDKFYNFDFQTALRERVTVRSLSIFDIEKERYSHISMNFVAESITDDPDEFVRACNCVMAGLKKGGYLTASFMSGSRGYVVNGVDFPAVAIDPTGVADTFRAMDDLRVRYIPIFGKPLRNGYNGIIHLTAKKNGK